MNWIKRLLNIEVGISALIMAVICGFFLTVFPSCSFVDGFGKAQSSDAQSEMCQYEVYQGGAVIDRQRLPCNFSHVNYSVYFKQVEKTIPKTISTTYLTPGIFKSITCYGESEVEYKSEVEK